MKRAGPRTHHRALLRSPLIFMGLLALAGQLRFQPWQLTRCPPAGPLSSCRFQAPSPMALSTSSPAFGPPHCPASETVLLPEPQLPCPAWLPTTCFPPALCCETTPRGARMCPYIGIHPRRLHASHAPSPLDLGTAFLPQHPTWCPQAHSCRPAPLGLGYPPSTLLQGRGSIPLRFLSPPPGQLQNPPHPRPRQLEASGFRRGDQPGCSGSSTQHSN